MSQRSSSLARGTAALLLVVSTSACASLLKSALGKAGVEDNTKPSHGSALAPSLASAKTQPKPKEGVHTSKYEAMPVPSLWEISRGQPYSVAYNATRWTSQNPCIPMPAGIADVLPVPEGAPATPLGSWGPFHLEAFGIPGMYFGGLFDPNGLDVSGQMMEHTARMTSQGMGCGYNVFVGVSFGSANRVVVSK